jgi:alpha-L-fucosidase 2
VWMEFSNPGDVSDYRRELDISQATSSVSYTAGGVKYLREYFVSTPDQVAVMHLTADKPGKISLRAALKSPHRLFTTKKIDDRTISLSLQVRNGALRGVSYLQVKTEKGKVQVNDQSIEISGADEVTLYLSAATNFINYKDVSGDPELLCKNTLASIGKKSYGQIKEAHIKEYQSYYNTFFLNVGSSQNESLPTDERIRKFSSTADPSLLTLFVQYGRYLMIASSRPGTRPANLQGIWNDLLAPPWGSKYTTNINAQMNYWPAEVLNLSPCHEPLFKMIDEVAKAGKQTARAHYGASGFVVHHNTDLWRGTAPINASNHGIWVSGGAWLCQHLWDHYLFTQDEKFLRERAYPVMKEAANFFMDFLVKDAKTGWLISTPSNSPEQGGLVAGPTMDHQIARELLKHCMEASEILKADESLRPAWKAIRDQIAPNQIGRFGQLQEWVVDKDDDKNRHRHVSHLWGVYPGTDITWDASPEIMKAARQSLLYRGDSGTGWSVAWKINLWSRFKDGDHSMLMVSTLLRPAEGDSGGERGGVYHNLFDAHPPFQIDGNFGGASGIAEMLVQSHQGYVDLLPALPTSLASGEVKGICARGGFVLNILWKNGKLQQVEVTSNAGKECVLKYGTSELRFATAKGKTYKFDGAFKKI